MNKKPNTSIQMFADFEGDTSTLFNTQAPDEVPVLTTRNMVLFPGILVPILLGRKASINLAKKLDKSGNGMICAIFCQRNADIDSPKVADLYKIGVYARLVKMIEMPNIGNITAIFQALGRCELETITGYKPYYTGIVKPAPEHIPDDKEKNTDEYKTFMADLHTTTERLINVNDEIPSETMMPLKNIGDDTLLINFVCTNLPFSVRDKIKLLQIGDISQRLMELLKLENRDIQLNELKNQIRQKTHEDLDEQQKEYFLQQQMKNIREELGSDNGSTEKHELEEKAKNKKWPDEVAKLFKKELDLDLKRAKTILDRNHYGMEKVKERILEYLAVLQLRGDLKSPILCLFGPPGVGKTSLGRSIAEAMKRKYIRMSLGGLHDESEIRGHRRTYVGAMPGRIIKGIQKAGSSNPVFILDEIDKVSANNYNGDPSSALLEVLDPEQNSTFHDNYLDLDYDLSKVFFIATANDISTIPRPLLDRMELIEVPGYVTEEKIEIAKRHLVPRELKNTGLDKVTPKIKFSKQALEKIIEDYTRESGVRQLEKQINKTLRKEALRLAMKEPMPEKAISASDIEGILGKPPFSRDIYQGNDYAGVVTGLAWTAVGGEILFIETSLSKGKGGKLTLTGNLGDVMKESAIIALQYVKAHCDSLGVDYRVFDNWNIHIHVPEGATPKDGPSAGITIATSIASALTQRKVRKNTAMTGEITLRGKVLPVGGIREKILAAKRAGITDIVICKDNKKDIEEIPQNYLKGVTFHYVENVQDVWNFALTNEKVDNPVDFTIEEDNNKDKKN
jgi:ATP-dependent Lon protease